jgi:hypothetical protein
MLAVLELKRTSFNEAIRHTSHAARPDIYPNMDPRSRKIEIGKTAANEPGDGRAKNLRRRGAWQHENDPK